MDERRRLARCVLNEGYSLSQVARDFGVSRNTARLWVERAKRDGIEALCALSRKPHNSPNRTSPELTNELLGLKQSFPTLGAKKLVVFMSDTISVRTGNRILHAHGLQVPRPPATIFIRFERDEANQLWQIDHKGMRKRSGIPHILSVIDDATRFNISLTPEVDQTYQSVTKALWEAFGCYGLPDAILSDNGAAFRNNGTWRVSRFDAWLMKLGVIPIHSRPYHPQTQGKVERFHGTLERELGEKLYVTPAKEMKPMLSAFQHFYNWQRPHEAIGQRVPGSIYHSSDRKRPRSLPKADYESGSIIRKVDLSGSFSFEGKRYKVGKGLIGESIEITEIEGITKARFFGFTLGNMEEFRIRAW